MNIEKSMNVEFTLNKPHFLRCDYNTDPLNPMINSFVLKKKYVF